MCYFCFTTLVYYLTLATRSYFHFWFTTSFFPNLRIKARQRRLTTVYCRAWPQCQQKCHENQGGLHDRRWILSEYCVADLCGGCSTSCCRWEWGVHGLWVISHLRSLRRTCMRKQLYTNISKKETRIRRKMLDCTCLTSNGSINSICLDSPFPISLQIFIVTSVS